MSINVGRRRTVRRCHTTASRLVVMVRHTDPEVLPFQRGGRDTNSHGTPSAQLFPSHAPREPSGSAKSVDRVRAFLNIDRGTHGVLLEERNRTVAGSVRDELEGYFPQRGRRKKTLYLTVRSFGRCRARNGWLVGSGAERPRCTTEPSIAGECLSQWSGGALAEGSCRLGTGLVGAEWVVDVSLMRRDAPAFAGACAGSSPHPGDCRSGIDGKPVSRRNRSARPR